MKRTNFAVAVIGLLAGLLVTGCHKNSLAQKSSAGQLAGGTNGAQTATNVLTRDLGALTLTNHYETCVRLGAGQQCFLTPKLLDGKNLELTLTLESKTVSGLTHDLSVRQVITRAGEPLAVAVGDFNLNLTPNIVAE